MLGRMSTKEYREKLDRRLEKARKSGERTNRHSLIASALFCAICIVCIAFGIGFKTTSIESTYQKFSESLDVELVNQELLGYKDTFQMYESSCLGNSPCQSLMGGYYCSKNGITVKPNPSRQSTTLARQGTSIELYPSIVSDINICKDAIVFRDTSTRKVYKYKFESSELFELGIENAGQLVTCKTDLYYIDFSDNSLNRYNLETRETEHIASFVESFVLAGEEVLYQDRHHSLYFRKMNGGSDREVSGEVRSFSFDGLLWVQNNSDIFQKGLMDRAFSEVKIGHECCKLYGKDGAYLFYQSDGGIYVHNVESGKEARINSSDEFISASAEERSLLLYNPSSKEYTVIPFSV